MNRRRPAEERFPVVVVSTFALDKILYKDHNRTEFLPGGPATWIQRVYNKLGTPHLFCLGTRMTSVYMEVALGEPSPGVIKTAGSKIVLPEKLAASALMINVLDDFDLSQILNFEGTVALDIAGYTRAGTFLQERKQVALPPIEIRERIDIIKANSEEFNLMPEIWRTEQMQKRILLHTCGADGLDVWSKGEVESFKSPRTKPVSTIGAGDTIGASFLHFYLQDPAEWREAAARALVEVGHLFDEHSDRVLLEE